MKAVVMAGGEGSRLRPLTLERPKPMATLANAPAMEHILRLLHRHGFREIIVTVHYLASVIEDYFGAGEDLDLHITYTHEVAPLGTAGSVGLAREQLTEPFLVISADALTDVNLSRLMEFHRQAAAEATLLLYRVPNPLEYGVVVTERDGRIARFQEKPSWGEVLSDTVNTGIYALEPSVFELIPPGKNLDFSLNVFPQLLVRPRSLYGFVADGYWTDVGTLEAYRQANADALTGMVDIGVHLPRGNQAPWIDPSATVDPRARLLGPVYVGKGAEVRARAVVRGPSVIGDQTFVDVGAEITESVVQSNVFVGAEAKLARCVVGRQAHIGIGATIAEGAVIGDGTSIGPGARVGANVRIWPRKFVETGAIVDRSLVHGEQARRTIFIRGSVAGVANFEITPEFAARLGAAWASSVREGEQVIANRDASRSARMIKRALMSGIASAGVHVVDIGAVPLPVALFATRSLSARAATHVRTSPYDHSSIDIQFVDELGIDLHKAGERKVETVFFREDFRRVRSEAIGEIIEASVVDDYVAAVLATVSGAPERRDQYGIVVDYMGGTCGVALPPMLASLGLLETAIDAAPSQLRPADYANVEPRRARLGRIVQSVEAMFGAVLGPGGTRVWLTDEAGRPLDAFTATGVMLKALAEVGRTGAVCLPFTIPRTIATFASELGYEVVRTRVGPAEIMRVAHDTQAVLVAHSNDWFAFPGVHPGADGMATVVYLAHALALTGRSVSSLIADVPPIHVQTRDVEVGWDKRAAVMRVLNQHASRVDEGDIDGVVFGNRDERAAVIPDTDRPLFQIFAEADTMKHADALADRMAGVVRDAAA